MTWWQMLLGMVAGGGLFFAGVWVGSRIARNEPLVPVKPKPPPVPIYDTPAERNAIRKAERDARVGVDFQEVRARG